MWQGGETSVSSTFFQPPPPASLASSEMWPITLLLLTSIWTRFQAIGCHTTPGCVLQGWPYCLQWWISPDSYSSSEKTKYTLATASHSQMFDWSLLTTESDMLFVLILPHLGPSLLVTLVHLLVMIEPRVADGWKWGDNRLGFMFQP